MSQAVGMVRPKQIKLDNSGDVLIADASGNGKILQAGSADTILRMDSLGVLGYGNILPKAITLTTGNLLVGASGVASEVNLGAEGNVIQADASGNAVAGALASQFVTFAPTTAGSADRADAATTVQAALQAVANAASYRFTGTAAPTGDMNQAAGYRIGDVFSRTDTNYVYIFTSESAGVATWIRVDQGVDSDVITYMYSGTYDATTAYPSNPKIGDYWHVSVGGDANGAITNADDKLHAGDGILWIGTKWQKIDNTDSQVAGTVNRVTITGNTDIGFTVDIASTYVGQNTITTLGTITTGTWNGATVDAAHGGLGIDTFTVGDILVADGVHSLRKQAIGAEHQVLTVNGSGTVAYAYVDVLRDPTTGVAFTQIKSGRLAATSATTDADDVLSFVTKGYIVSKFQLDAKVIIQEMFTPSGTTSGLFNFDVTHPPVDSSSIEIFVNGWKLEFSEYQSLGDTSLSINTTSIGSPMLGYELDSDDEIMVEYIYNP